MNSTSPPTHAASDANWSTHQLSGFLESVVGCQTEETAIAAARQWSSESLEAEVAAVLSNGAVLEAIGFPRDAPPARELFAVAAGESSTITIDGIGPLMAIAAHVEELNGALVLARSGTDQFQADEVGLLRAMARTLSMTLRSIRVLQRERERQRFLERLSKIQLSISRRAPLPQVLDAIVGGAHELLGDEVVALRLVDREEPEYMTIASSVGVSRAMLAETRRTPVRLGAGGRAIIEDRLVKIQNYPLSDGAIERFAAANLKTAMAAPIHENGRPTGSIVVATYSATREYTDTEAEMLQTFAHHASMALNDAKAVDEMRTLAYHDALTSLPNRALFTEHLDRALVNARRMGTQLAVLFLDLDRFKLVNDSLGHGIGDRLLAGVGERLRRCLRASDLAARFGGDEFAVLVENATPEGAGTLAETICHVFETPFDIDGHELLVTASVGVAVDAGGTSNAEALLRNADLAMYRAKVDHPGHHMLFETDMHVVVSDRVQLESALRRAVALDDFEVDYQPIVHLNSGAVNGVEALVRWRRDGTLVPPAEFVPIAEEMGLITQIGRLVLRQAMEHARGWQQLSSGFASLGVSINLSPRQLYRADFVDDVREALDATGFDPSLLTLEITETALMRDIATVRGRLMALHEMGIHFALDDFGTGYSSLTYLRQFPIDVLKVDRSFIAGVSTDRHDASVTRAIVQLGKTLDLTTVAEGVERVEQVHELMRLRCEYGQGYYFARPMSAGDMTQFLRRPPERETVETALSPSGVALAS